MVTMPCGVSSVTISIAHHAERREQAASHAEDAVRPGLSGDGQADVCSTSAPKKGTSRRTLGKEQDGRLLPAERPQLDVMTALGLDQSDEDVAVLVG